MQTNGKWTAEELFSMVMAMEVPVSFGKRMAGDMVFTTCRPGDLPLNSLAHVLVYGVRQKVQDAGASDKTPTDKRDSGEYMWKRLCEGDIGRQKGDGVTDLQYEARIIAANLLRQKKPDEWKVLKDAERKVLNARLDEIVAKNASITEDAQSVLDRKAADRKRMEKLSVEIDL